MKVFFRCCYGGINIYISRISVKQITLHNVGGLIQSVERPRQRLKFPKRERIQPQDCNIETQFEVNPKVPIHHSPQPFPFGNYKFGIDIHTPLYLIDNQQEPTTQHRKLCSIFYNNPNWERNLKKNGYMYMYN